MQYLQALITDAVYDALGNGSADIWLRRFAAAGVDEIHRLEQVDRLMPVGILLARWRERLRHLGEVQHTYLRRPFKLRQHLLYRCEDVPALELLKRGHEHFKLRYLLVPRKQGTGLYIEQVRGHLDKLACDLKIHALHFVKIFKILIKNIRNADITDLYFIFRQEEQDQAQGAFKVLKLVLVPDNALQKETGIIHYRSLIKQFYDQIAGKLSGRNQI